MPTFSFDIFSPADAPLLRDCVRVLERIPESRIAVGLRDSSQGEDRDLCRARASDIG